ncbi:MAG TPA: sugar-binding protein [Thermoguttaceae bacterium]|nr:sugar-binding protein [Thermoguttaceae bacterium]
MAVLIAKCMMPLAQAENMIGQMSQNEGILVLPVPGKVVIDGNLKDWDWSGRVWMFADAAVRERYSAEVAAMWDAENLYLAAKWKDPTPMFSLVDPAINANDGWKSDSWQMRVEAGDRTLWVTTWYYTVRKQSALDLAYWNNPNDSRGGVGGQTLIANPGSTSLGKGAEMAYKADPDGKGFVQEIRLPWNLLFKAVPEIKPGLAIRLGCEFLWGDVTGGKAPPTHRIADNMAKGRTDRMFYWTTKDAWGEARLVEKGNVPVRQYGIAAAQSARIEGTVPVRVTVPVTAKRFTIAIDDDQGHRVRNLAGDLDPRDYATKEEGATRSVEVKWDCLDDAGAQVKPGAYKVRGLAHDGLDALYEMCFYNPGTPPWATGDGRGGWGADHTAPIAVAAAGDGMAVSFPSAEGGSGTIGLGADGRKSWGEKRGAVHLAGNDRYVYTVLADSRLCRYARTDGAYRPFVRDGQTLPFELPVSDFVGSKVEATALAANATRVAVACKAPQQAPDGRLAILDAETAAVLKVHVTPAITGLAFSRKGDLYGISEGRICRINPETGASTPVPTPGLEKPAALAVDLDGNLVAIDAGKDNQVKAYSPDGKLMYTCGRKGGRPMRGAFDAQAMTHMSSVAVDGTGQVWVVESWDYPRRVSVWGRDGKLVRDYIGNTNYMGTGCYLHEQDPTLAYCGPIEMKLDKKTRTWNVSQILWLPDTASGESFEISTGSHAQPQRFTSSAGGKSGEYLFTHPYNDGPAVVFMERRGTWLPVAAIGPVAGLPAGVFTAAEAKQSVFWNDANGDGKVQRSECELTDKRLPTNSGWGGRIDANTLTIYANGIVAYKPVGFDADGAPRYGLEGMREVGVSDYGDLVPVPGEDQLLCLSFKGYAGPTKLLGIDLKNGRIEWSYPNPFPGVHGSHRATMPKPGMLIGPLKICGVANVNTTVGNVFMLRGNLGQDFLMTTDGLCISALFEDVRLPGGMLPPTEEALIGKSVKWYTNKDEPFNGWFGKQADGRIRTVTGMPREGAMVLEVTGLETIRRFDGGTIALDAAVIAGAAADNARRAEAAKSEKVTRYVVKKALRAPTLDGNPEAWKDAASLTISREGLPDSAVAQLAYDDNNLYARFAVKDASPWRNEGKDFGRLFKTGDAVDIQLGMNPTAAARAQPVEGDVRIVIGQVDGKPVAVLMAPVAKGAPANAGKTYTSPVGSKTFARVEVMKNARIFATPEDAGYVVEAAIPWQAFGGKPATGATLRGDAGFLSSDNQGLRTTARTYWMNKDTNLVSDEPLEAWLYPSNWGELVFE